MIEYKTLTAIEVPNPPPGTIPATQNAPRGSQTAKSGIVDPQPDPKPSNGPAIWSLVMLDMAQRDVNGSEKYGTRLRPNNGRDALVDLYQELLDSCVYIRQEIWERDHSK